eukprot:1154047-Pyramimonas_sp.AAC.1
MKSSSRTSGATVVQWGSKPSADGPPWQCVGDNLFHCSGVATALRRRRGLTTMFPLLFWACLAFVGCVFEWTRII